MFFPASDLEARARELIAQASLMPAQIPRPAVQAAEALGDSLPAPPQADPYAVWLRDVRASYNLLSISLAREKRRVKQAKRWLREAKRRLRRVKRMLGRMLGPVRHLLGGNE